MERISLDQLGLVHHFGDLRQLQADFFVRQISGSSGRILALCNDGEYYVLTLVGNPQGRNALANELLGVQMCDAMGLPVPPSAFVFVSAELIARAPSRWFTGYLGGKAPKEGLHFGSRLLGSPTGVETMELLPRRLTSHVANLEKFVGMFVLDLFANNQGPRRAVFWRGKRGAAYRVTFVDHAKMFGGPRCIFDRKKFQGLYFERSVYVKPWSPSTVEKYVYRLQNIHSRVLESHQALLPPSWCDVRHHRFCEGMNRRSWDFGMLIGPYLQPLAAELYPNAKRKARVPDIGIVPIEPCVQQLSGGRCSALFNGK